MLVSSVHGSTSSGKPRMRARHCVHEIYMVLLARYDFADNHAHRESDDRARTPFLDSLPMWILISVLMICTFSPNDTYIGVLGTTGAESHVSTHSTRSLLKSRLSVRPAVVEPCANLCPICFMFVPYMHRAMPYA